MTRIHNAISLIGEIAAAICVGVVTVEVIDLVCRWIFGR